MDGEMGQRIDGELGQVVGPQTFRIERMLPGPIDRVWAYLTDPELRGRWFASGPMELKAGGKTELFFKHDQLSHEPTTDPAMQGGHRMAGEVTKVDPGRMVAFTMTFGGQATEVEIALSEVGDDVRLVLTHTRLPNRGAMLSVSGGWHAHLGILEDNLRGQTPRGFWTAHSRARDAYDRVIPA